MSSSAPDPTDATPDPAVVRAEERLAFLRELTEIGMELARGLREQAASGVADPKPGKSPAETFDRLSRAIRLTITLEAKTDEALSDLKAGVVRERQGRRIKAAEQAESDAKTKHGVRSHQAFCRVLTVIDAESQDEEDFDGLIEALNERLAEDPAYEDFGERPLREVVERLCRDLGLNPDWSRWAGEDWDDEVLAATPNANPFVRPSRRPVVWAWPVPGDAGQPSLRQLE